MPILYPLSDTAIRTVKPGDPRKRLTDGKGLYLLLFVKGGAHGWRLDYAIHGRRKTLSLGTYPETSLKLAREKAEEARRLVAAGTDPSDHRKAAKAEAQQERQEQKLVAEGQAQSDPTRDLKDALRKPIVRHMAAITDPARLAELLRAIDGYHGSLVVCTALRLAPMLMLRPGELRFAQWAEIDLDTATWAIPAQRMKREKAGKLNGSPHLVPLPRQAVDLLRALHPLTGRGPYVFRGERNYDRAMSENTVNAALRRMGYSTKEDITGHGFRATARTILDERLGFDRAAIEAQLAHAVKDVNGRAYNRTEFVEQRRTMLQAWADYLDTLRQGKVLPLRAHGG